MSQSELERRTVRTWLGGLSYWTLPEPDGSVRPVVLWLLDSDGGLRRLNRLPGLLQEVCQVAIAELPISPPDAPPRGHLGHLSGVLGEATHRAFRGRPVVLVGAGDAAIVAVAANAPEIVRVVAIEPPIHSASLPAATIAALRARAAGAPVALRDLLSEVYGVEPDVTASAERQHGPALAAARRPVDVLLGGRLPGDGDGASWVGADERAALVGRPNLLPRTAPGAGHDLVTEGAQLVLAALREAVAWANALRRPDDALARGLALACPRDVARVRYDGAAFDLFRAAYLPLNPTAEVVAGPGAGAFDVIALQAPDPSALDAGELLGRLAEAGTLVAVCPLGPEAGQVEARLAAAGATLAPPAPELSPLAGVLVRARRGAAPATRVDIVAYARTLMDIRTYLPAEALRTSPLLEVKYGAPPFTQPTEPAPPRVVVLQRPAAWTSASWARTVARAIIARQVIVIEIDDHPELISQIIRGRSVDPHEWDRFVFAHAIQTSTEPLRELFSTLNPEVLVCPNAVFELAPFPTGPRPQKVFYGGVTRGPFVVEVARSLAPAIAAHPDVEFHVLGDRAVFDALPTARKTFTDYLPYRGYLDAMAACTISLSPLEDRPYVETKSDAKYLDASRAGLLTIASPVVYGRTIQHGRNGLIAGSVADWPAMLDLALSEPVGRERMARAAWEDVRDHRMFGRQIPERQAWYASLVARHEDLSQAVLARAPAVAAELDKLRVRAGSK